MKTENERRRVYLDHAGTALPSKEQLEDISRDVILGERLGNPHSDHASSRHTRHLIERARNRILTHFHTDADHYQVVFTANSTAALHLLAETFDFGPLDHKCEKGFLRQEERNLFDLPQRTFVYLMDSHTSVVGMREVAKCARICCLTATDWDQLSLNNNHYKSQKLLKMEDNIDSRSLFVLTGQSNFCGRKYPLDLIESIQNGLLGSSSQWFVCVDASALVSCSDFDLSLNRADFVTVSFYKMFGYPTGIGALLVRNGGEWALKKRYFGGGNVQLALSGQRFHRMKTDLSQRFEDGTLDMYGIASLSKGFDDLDRFGGMKSIEKRTFDLAKLTFDCLKTLQHGHNGSRVVSLYCHCEDFGDTSQQGPIVNFNVFRSNGECVGYVEVSEMAALYGIELRTGCFCNQGACQQYLLLSDSLLVDNYKQSGKECGDHLDVIGGRPVGSARASFGRQSSIDDIIPFLQMIYDCFVERPIFGFVEFIKSQNSLILSDRLEQQIASGQITPTNYCQIPKFTKILEIPKFATENKTVMVSTFHLAGIYVYPVKSCAAFKIDTNWSLSLTGLKYDRNWMIVKSSETKRPLTQKRCPRLCFLYPIIDLKCRTIILTCPLLLRDIDQSRQSAVPIPLDDNSSMSDSQCVWQTVCSDRVSGVDCGQTVSDWLSELLEIDGCRLLRYNAHISRQSKFSPDDQVSFANEAQYLLVNRASVRQLTDVTGLKEDELCLRFRPNFVVDGLVPFSEDKASHVLIGSVRFKVVGKCSRCEMICVNQTTGQKEPTVLTALGHFRSGKPRTFGIYLSADKSVANADRLVGTGDPVSFIYHNEH